MSYLDKMVLAWNSIVKRLIIKSPVKEIKLSNLQVEVICEEIQRQWLHLVTTRAVFTNKDFPNSDKYESGGLYASKGISFRVEVLNRSQNFVIGSSGLSNWHNKNYVIRLYGILDKYQILYLGRKAYKSKLMELIYLLRPEMGAHGSGRKPKPRCRSKEKVKKSNSVEVI